MTCDLVALFQTGAEGHDCEATAAELARMDAAISVLQHCSHEQKSTSRQRSCTQNSKDRIIVILHKISLEAEPSNGVFGPFYHQANRRKRVPLAL